ncbi:MAG: hypothetical protein K1Y36_09925 [Blastocatellia bacterium]|nr:hypothetical protein [Blastocatellia bacterium]
METHSGEGIVFGVTDTAPEMAGLQRKLWAQMPLERKFTQIARLTRSVRSLARYGIELHHPDWDSLQINHELLRRVYGDSISPFPPPTTAMNTVELPVALFPIVRACEKFGIRYRVGGSLASSLFGEPRATNDADVVLDLKSETVEVFVAEIQNEYVIFADSLKKAIERETCLNALHSETVFKIDLFPLKSRPYDQQAQHRMTVVPIEHEGTVLAVSFVTAEDMVIAKLEWYRKGNEVSERQWRDILGLLKTEAVFLDYDYLERWTTELHLHDLYERALTEIQAGADPKA